MALPELYKQQDYQRQTFDKDAEFRRLYGVNASKRDTRKFNRYWNSDQRINDEKAFNAAQDAAELAHMQSEQKKYFDSMDARIAAAREQNAARGAAALNSINTSLAAKPIVPVSKPDPTPVPKTLTPRSEAEWNRIASEATNGQLKTMADVEAWQRANGFSEDQIDGKFGNYSKSYFNKHNMGSYVDPIEAERLAKEEAAKQQAWLNHMRGLGYKEVKRPDGTTHFENGDTMYMNNGRMQVGNTKMDYDYTTLTKPTFDLMGYATQNGLNKFYNHGGKRYVRYDPFGIGDFLIGEDGEMYHSGRWGDLGKKVTNSSVGIEGSDHYNNYQKVLGTLNSFKGVTSNKQGGTMNRINYFQQGGAAPQQQDMQAQVVALVQAAMQGDQKATQTVNQIMEAAKAGDQQAIQIAQLMEQVIKQMQGQAVAAKYGAKLNYLQSLKCGGKAKKKEQGGKVCPACEKAIVNKKSLITKHQQGKTLDYNKATRFYNKWTPEEITKLQMFLSNTDKLGDAAYTGEWGKMNKETLDAIAAYQTKHKLTGDGMWGFWTDQVHGVMDNATLNKGSYTADYNNKHEQGDLLALPTNFTYTKLSDLPIKDAQAVINYYSAYPELLYSDDPEHAKWRQVFHNSGQAGADFLNQSFGAMSVADRATVDPKKTTTSHKTAELQSDIAEGNTRAAAQLLPALTLPFAIGGVTSALAGGAGLAGYTGLAGSMIGAPVGGNVGARRGRKRGEKKQDELYQDEVAERYGVASAVHDPKRRIAEEEAKGRNVGTLTGGFVGGAAGSIAGAGAEAGYYSLLGQGRANLGYVGTPATAQPSVGMYGTTTPPTVQGVSNMQMLRAGLKPANLSAGRTRLGGTYGIRFNHNGKFYNAGTPASQEAINAANTYYNNPMSPLRVNFGGTTNTGAGAKLGLAYGVNVPAAVGVGAQVAPMGIIMDDAISDTQPNHSVRQQRRADRKEERKEKRQERHKKLVSRTAESTTD